MEGMVNDMTAPNMTETMGAFELPTLGWRDDDPLLQPIDAVRATELAMFEGMTAEEFEALYGPGHPSDGG